MAERAQIESPSRRGADDIWTKCPSCKDMAFRKEVERNLNVCLKCDYHFRLTVEQRLAITADRGSWRELFAELAADDPLEFTDTKPYRERLAQARRSRDPRRHVEWRKEQQRRVRPYPSELRTLKSEDVRAERRSGCTGFRTHPDMRRWGLWGPFPDDRERSDPLPVRGAH